MLLGLDSGERASLVKAISLRFAIRQPVWSMLKFVTMWGKSLPRAPELLGCNRDSLGSLLYAVVALFHGQLFGVGLNFA